MAMSSTWTTDGHADHGTNGRRAFRVVRAVANVFDATRCDLLRSLCYRFVATMIGAALPS